MLFRSTSKHGPIDLVVHGSHETQESTSDIFGEVLWAGGDGGSVLAKQTVGEREVGNADNAVMELGGFEDRAILLRFFSIEATLPDGAKGREE